MKRSIISIICVFVLMPVAFCHPPTNIEIKISGAQVDIVVTHPVSDPESHFIKLIEVEVNGEKMISQSFGLQADKNVQKAIYLTPSLKKGDTLAVDADCNQYGDLTKKITVE